MPIDPQTLGRAVKQAQYRHHRALDTQLAAIGTSLAQWDALRAIARSPGASARVLAEETFQTQQAFGTLATRMQARGLIERTPGHGRAIEHRLTPHGQHILRAANDVADKVLTASFAALSEHERTVLLELLHRIGDRPDAVIEGTRERAGE
ncbi:winged helix-turn-helix transcriptional regulator [Nocardia sp. BSTN01]|uniref:MarR family winged helix-turn-helix transcriptional regulator n=1 Tax=Nocardia sp. BSTN01 TaxID=2783665 RepID=UPI00188FA3FA|nr:MarR family winged helix-turn-helix transcriptional regulator [Nocardia sp. BSTN01]MBF4996996.1 winged helix-turn-helix transcriptional regulator [Nocardia sp. BSTN01]